MATTTPLNLAALDTLKADLEALPAEHDGIDLGQNRQTALIQLDQLMKSVRILKKLSA